MLDRIHIFVKYNFYFLLSYIFVKYKKNMEKYKILNDSLKDKKHELSSSCVLFKYYYTKEIRSANLGDYIQTIATHEILKQHKSYNFTYWNRDDLNNYPNNSIAIMQGWFSHTIAFIPNRNITPIYIGTHFNKYIQNFISCYPFLLKNHEIGCRDLYTLNFLKSNGFNAYFSRCLTLTLPKREENSNQNKVFLVNVDLEIKKLLPKKVQQEGIMVNQKNIIGNYDDFKHNWKLYYDNAKEFLDKYKNEAKLIITTALHCASPCIAMGIPVILISDDPNEQLSRFSALEGIIKIYTIEDLKNDKIDFNPESIDIEQLKQYMLENVELTIIKAMGGGIDENRLLFIRNQITNWKNL